MCSSWTRCARTSLCNDRCRLLYGHPCCGAEAVPHGPALHAHSSVLGQGCCGARRCSTTGAAVPQLQFFTVVDTPVFAQWLIPMVLTIEISQFQLDKVVFVPVVQNVQFILPSTSLPWRRGWFRWSCMSKTIEFPPGAVHVVVDVPVVLLHRFHRCAWSRLCSILWRLRSWRLTWLFGPCTQVHGQGCPCHQGGKGVAGTPGANSQVFCHPIRCIVGTTLDRHGRVVNHSYHTHHTHPTPHTHHTHHTPHHTHHTHTYTTHTPHTHTPTDTHTHTPTHTDTRHPHTTHPHTNWNYHYNYNN